MSSYNFTIQSIGINKINTTNFETSENGKFLKSINTIPPKDESCYFNDTITMKNLYTLEYDAIDNFLTAMKEKNLIADFDVTPIDTTSEPKELKPKYINTVLKINNIDDKIIHKLKLTPEQLKIFKIAYCLLNKFLIKYDITINFFDFIPNDFKDIKEIEESSFYQTGEEKHS